MLAAGLRGCAGSAFFVSVTISRTGFSVLMSEIVTAVILGGLQIGVQW
jgi:hypothetical protein